MHLYYDWNGRPITADEWHRLLLGPRVVESTNLGRLGHVSTVWLGLDHGYPPPWGGDIRPLIFETMVFGGPLDDAMERYSSVDEARVGHEFMIMRLTTLRDQVKSKPLFHNGRKPRR